MNALKPRYIIFNTIRRSIWDPAYCNINDSTNDNAHQTVYINIYRRVRSLLAHISHISYIILILTFAIPAKATSPIPGHMKPLPSETLAQPIQLSCGITIYEWRGSKQNSKLLNKYCSFALKNFKPFTNRHGIPTRTAYVNFGMSLLPDSTNYRDLNDMQYRFIDRQQQEEVWGYTSYDQEYVFIVSDTGLNIFEKVFIHEVFHAISMSTGLFDSHPGDKYMKYMVDERLAREFTKELGLGE